MSRARIVVLLAGALLSGAGLVTTGCRGGAGSGKDAAEPIAARYAELLVRHRPDLAARWGASEPSTAIFQPLTEPTIAAHLEALDVLRREAEGLPSTSRADTLRARLTFEIDQTRPGGALRTDPFVWLDIVEAAVRAPFAGEPTKGGAACRQLEIASQELRQVPEALRSGAILLRGSPAPDPAAFEERMTRMEHLFRQELPERTKACREARRLAEFVEADTLAAASLMDFRNRVLPGP